MQFELSVECGKCGKMLRANESKLLHFTFCGCDNKARICLQNRKEMAHLLGAQDEDHTFIYVGTSGEDTKGLKMTLRKWNTLQYEFKTFGKISDLSDKSSAK